jgi:hypothetical protein
MTDIPATDIIQSYQQRGYISIPTDSGTGSTILVNRDTKRVVKINYDSAYEVFARYAKSNPSPHLPKVYFHHQCDFGDGIFSNQFSITEMELLDPLNPEEQEHIINWIQSIFRGVRQGEDLSTIADDFGLNDTFQTLHDLARRSGTNLDLEKSTNYMIRRDSTSAIYVFIDPFN